MEQIPTMPLRQSFRTRDVFPDLLRYEAKTSNLTIKREIYKEFHELLFDILPCRNNRFFFGNPGIAYLPFYLLNCNDSSLFLEAEKYTQQEMIKLQDKILQNYFFINTNGEQRVLKKIFIHNNSCERYLKEKKFRDTFNIFDIDANNILRKYFYPSGHNTDAYAVAQLARIILESSTYKYPNIAHFGFYESRGHISLLEDLPKIMKDYGAIVTYQNFIIYGNRTKIKNLIISWTK